MPVASLLGLIPMIANSDFSVHTAMFLLETLPIFIFMLIKLSQSQFLDRDLATLELRNTEVFGNPGSQEAFMELNPASKHEPDLGLEVRATTAIICNFLLPPSSFSV